MAERQCCQLFGAAIEERVGAYDERTGLLLAEGGESFINFRCGARVQDIKLQPERCGRRP
jgi:hypothetical protein